ncbi:MAG: hypothetical protein OEV21_02275 [Thermoplasmata archaeon]|nr:hypothetical protein [Thermoplasmata archaeon]
MRFFNELSALSVHLIIVIFFSSMLTIIWPLRLNDNIETWYFLHSSVFQGVAALAGICLIAAFFFYERLEVHLENLKNDCVRTVRRLIKRGGIMFDEATIIGILQDTGKKMKQLEETATQKSVGTDVEKAKEKWNALYDSYIWVYESLKDIAHTEARKSSLTKFVEDYFLPMFAPILWSIISICLTEPMISSPFLLSFSMYLSLLLTILVISKLVYGMIWGTWHEFVVRRLDPSDFILNSLARLGISNSTADLMIEMEKSLTSKE